MKNLSKILTLVAFIGAPTLLLAVDGLHNELTIRELKKELWSRGVHQVHKNQVVKNEQNAIAPNTSLPEELTHAMLLEHKKVYQIK